MPYSQIKAEFGEFVSSTPPSDLFAVLKPWFEAEKFTDRQHILTLTRETKATALTPLVIMRMADARHEIRRSAVQILDEFGWAKGNLDLFEGILKAESEHPSEHHVVVAQLLSIFESHGKNEHLPTIEKFAGDKPRLITTCAKRAIAAIRARDTLPARQPEGRQRFGPLVGLKRLFQRRRKGF